jgi:E-phenylitaconyl-CoA hydratase
MTATTPTEPAVEHDLGTAAVSLEVADGIATITLRRPERRNALGPELLGGLARAWTRVRDDDDVRAAVLAGEGPVFCAGADLDELLTAPPDLAELLAPALGLRPDRGIELRKPVVAAVGGPCLGGGLTLLLATDIRFAAPEARFATPEVGWGVLASCGGTQRLVQQVPWTAAMHLLLSGEQIDAAEALRIGLVNRVVPGADLMTTARDCAARIARLAPLAVQATKELALRAHDTGTAEGLRLEDLMVRLLQDTDDAAEGLRAWRERRTPRYSGR